MAKFNKSNLLLALLHLGLSLLRNYDVVRLCALFGEELYVGLVLLSSVLSVWNLAQVLFVCSVSLLKIIKTSAHCSSLVPYGALWDSDSGSCSAVC